MFHSKGLPGGGPAPLYLNECIKLFGIAALVSMILALGGTCGLIVPNVMDIGGDCPTTIAGILETVIGVCLIGVGFTMTGFYCYSAMRRWWSDTDVTNFMTLHWSVFALVLLCLVGAVYSLYEIIYTPPVSETCIVGLQERIIPISLVVELLLAALLTALTALRWGRKIREQCRALLLMTKKHR